MPPDSTVWIVLLVIGGLVLILALWLGRGLKIRKENGGFSIEAREKPPEQMPEQKVSVGRDLRIQDARVGDVAGIKGDDVQDVPRGNQDIDVLSGGVIKDADVGDIAGIKRERPSPEDES